MNAKMYCHECLGIIDLPDGRDTQLLPLFESHGHMPEQITLICPCGETHNTGPEIHPDVRVASEKAIAWWDIHEYHKEL